MPETPETRCATTADGAHIAYQVLASGSVDFVSARGVRGAEAIAAGVRPLGIEISAGLHTGEVANEDAAGEHELKGVPDRWRLYRAVS